jgi:hypothetical protein
MAGNWLNSPPGWAVSLATGNTPTGAWKRFVLTGANKRRWEVRSRDGNELRELAKLMHTMKLCRPGDPLDAELPAGLIPEGVREVLQRQCRDCTQVRLLERFDGGARSCKGCTWKYTHGRKDVVACPACQEPRSQKYLAEVDGLGLACPSCAAEARRAIEKAAAEVVLVRASLPAIQAAAPARAPAPAVVEPPRLDSSPALRLPQIRDFGRLRLLLQHVASGVTDPRGLGERMGARTKHAARHASFYRQAAEVLGLLEVRRWALTALGERFLAAAAGSDDEREVLRDAIKGAASLGPLVGAVLSTKAPELAAVVAEVAALLPKLSRATIERRVRDTLSWRAVLGLTPVARARRKPAPAPRLQLELWVPNAPPPAPPMARPEDFDDLLPACMSF